jgi:hypothetical protein
MALPNIFEKQVSDEMIARINNLTPDSIPQWGKMDAAKMLAHLNVAYETFYEPGKHPAPNFLMKFILKNFIKNKVVGEAPMPKNSPTAPYFIIKSDKDFTVEKQRLVDYINRTQQMGEAHFEGLESPSFGAMTAHEYSNLMYKHLNHHLTQFGA